MESEIKQYFDHIKIINENFKQYLDKLEISGFSGTEPYLFREINKLMEMPKIPEYKDDLEYYFEIVNIINQQFLNYFRIMTIFQENKININRQGSITSSGATLTQNYISDLILRLIDLENIFNHFRNLIQSNELNSGISNILLNKIEDFIQFINRINGLYKKYVDQNQGKNVIGLFINLLSKIINLNTGNSEGKIVIKYVNLLLENLKTEVLYTDDIKNIGTQNKSNNAIQRLVQLFDLVPYNLSVSLEKIIEKLNVQAGTLDQAMKILSSGTKKFGYILISNITKNPLDYNFWGLVDQNYLEKNNLIQPENSGISPTLIKRYETIIPLKPMETKQEFIKTFDQEFIKSSPENNYFYIFETIDGLNYRILVPWNVFSGEPILYVPAIWFENIDRAPSRRVECYNLILESEILKNLEEPIISLAVMNTEELIKTENYWKSLRNKIKNEMINDFNILFTREIIETDVKLSYKRVENLILDDYLYKMALNHITDNIELDNVEKTNSSEILEQFKIELNMSYFRDLANIQKSFKRDVENLYKKDFIRKFENLIKSGDKDLVIKNRASVLFGEILEEVLERFINKKSSIYITIENKFEILSKCFKS